MKNILAEYDDEQDLYIETQAHFNEGESVSSKPGVKILFLKEILAEADKTIVQIREVK